MHNPSGHAQTLQLCQAQLHHFTGSGLRFNPTGDVMDIVSTYTEIQKAEHSISDNSNTQQFLDVQESTELSQRWYHLRR